MDKGHVTGRDDLRERVRWVHRTFPSGVAVVTTAVEGLPYGLAVNAFASVSMEPPLVLACVKATAQTHDHLYASEHVGISFLAHDQAGLAARFARSGGEKFADVDWHFGERGVPLLDGVTAHMEIVIRQRLGAGTHTIFLGEVVEAEATARPPLIYVDGAFFDGERLSPVGESGG